MKPIGCSQQHRSFRSPSCLCPFPSPSLGPPCPTTVPLLKLLTRLSLNSHFIPFRLLVKPPQNQTQRLLHPPCPKPLPNPPSIRTFPKKTPNPPQNPLIPTNPARRSFARSESGGRGHLPLRRKSRIQVRGHGHTHTHTTILTKPRSFSPHQILAHRPLTTPTRPQLRHRKMTTVTTADATPQNTTTDAPTTTDAEADPTAPPAATDTTPDTATTTLPRSPLTKTSLPFPTARPRHPPHQYPPAPPNSARRHDVFRAPFTRSIRVRRHCPSSPPKT